MNNNKLFFIYGGNGCGKTWLIKNYLKDFEEIKTEFGYYSIDKKQKNIAIGKYSNKFGGGDSIKNVYCVFKLLNFILENFNNINIFIEDPMIYSMKRFIDLLLFYKYEKKCNINLILILISNENMLKNILTRNNFNKINIPILCKKYKVTINNFLKAKKIKEFNCYILNNDKNMLKNFMEIINNA